MMVMIRMLRSFYRLVAVVVVVYLTDFNYGKFCVQKGKQFRSEKFFRLLLNRGLVESGNKYKSHS